MRRALFFAVALTLSGEIFPLRAMSGFGCSGVAGSVIFRDTFYGLLTGGILASVYILAREDWEGTGKKLATGGLVGSVGGFGLGITEIMLRDCHEPARPGMAGEDRRWHGDVVLTGDGSPGNARGIAAALEARW